MQMICCLGSIPRMGPSLIRRNQKQPFCLLVFANPGSLDHSDVAEEKMFLSYALLRRVSKCLSIVVCTIQCYCPRLVMLGNATIKAKVKPDHSQPSPCL